MFLYKVVLYWKLAETLGGPTTEMVAATSIEEALLTIRANYKVREVHLEKIMSVEQAGTVVVPERG